MIECEARQLLKWPLHQRQEYLKAKPVQARVEALKAEMLRLHRGGV